MVEYDTQEKKKDLENIKKVVVKFKGWINTEVRRQENLDMVEEQYFKREELSEKYMVNILYEQNNEKFEKKYLKKVERNQ